MKQRGRMRHVGTIGWEAPGPAQWAQTWVGVNSPTEFTNQACSWAVLPRRGFHGSGEGPGSGCGYEQHSPSDDLVDLARLRDMTLLSRDECGLWGWKTWILFHHLCDLAVGPWESPLGPGASAASA